LRSERILALVASFFESGELESELGVGPGELGASAPKDGAATHTHSRSVSESAVRALYKDRILEHMDKQNRHRLGGAKLPTVSNEQSLSQ
jgi:hypothetical protein